MTLMKRSEGYLKEPYSRVIIPDTESGTFTAQILEFPGCIAQGDTVEEAYAQLELAADSWIQVAIDQRQEIPRPFVNHEYSGRIALRLPKSLHQQVTLAALGDDTSINQYIVMAIAEKIGAAKFYDRLVKELDRRAFFAEAANTTSSTVVPAIGTATDYAALPMPAWSQIGCSPVVIPANAKEFANTLEPKFDVTQKNLLLKAA